MLKAYDYAEPNPNKIDIQDAGLFNKEKEIAQEYVINHPFRRKEMKCPACDSRVSKMIFSKWNVEYLLCEDCYTIFVPVDNEVIEDYLKSEKMNCLRTSSEYQEQAGIRRNDIWEEQISWAQFRIFRYLGHNTGLEVIDYGNRYIHHINKFKASGICSKYELRDSILELNTEKVNKADIILYINQLQHELNPIKTLSEIRTNIKEDGLLILNTRLGSGFDILTLKGGMDGIFPYEHVMLPSRKGLELMLEKAGFELLEITTPGTRDMEAVLKNKDKIEDGNFFVKYLIETADFSTLADFQQFLQKSGLSSFAQVVAKARTEKWKR